MVLAGAVGAAALPPIVVNRRAERRIVGASVLVTAAGGLLLAFEHAVAVDAIVLVPIGLLLLTDLPVILELSERRAGAAAGTVTALLWLAGQRGRAASSRCSCNCSCTTRRRRSCCSPRSASARRRSCVALVAAGSRVRSTNCLRRRTRRPRPMIGYRQMEHKDAAHEEPRVDGRPAADRAAAREREALRRRVRESLLRCPDPNVSRSA